MTVVEGLYTGLGSSPPRGGRRLSVAGAAAQAAAADAKMVGSTQLLMLPCPMRDHIQWADLITFESSLETVTSWPCTSGVASHSSLKLTECSVERNRRCWWRRQRR